MRSPLFFLCPLLLFGCQVWAGPLENKSSGLCIEVDGGSTSNGATVVQNTCDDSDQQDWVEVPVAGGFLLQATHSGQCLDVKWAVTTDGMEFIQWPCHGNGNQTFNWDGNALVVSHSSKCITVRGASTSTGAVIEQQPCLGGDDQLFNVSTSSLSNLIFFDDFEGDLSQWTQTDTTRSGIGSHTVNSGGGSLYLRHGYSDVTTTTIDANVYQADLTVWIRRGDDSFSKNPDSNENLTLSYLDQNNSWITLETFAGDGTEGEVLSRSYSLPRSALHSNLQLRFTMTDGSGSDWDYWHIDDVQIAASTETFSCEAQVTLLSDDFESGLGQWTVSDSAYVGIGTHTANSSSSSIYLRNETASLTSMIVDASGGTEVALSVWVRRGSDSFSEDPDENEDLSIEYLDKNGFWQVLQTLPGDGTQGEIFQLSYSLPTDALHSQLQVRFSYAQGSGVDWDYWHIDDVSLTLANCSVSDGVDHFVIAHDQAGLYCAAEYISVTAYDNQSAVVGNYSNTITLDTQAGKGTWSLLTGNGTLTDATADDGLATYTFASADNGTATFTLSYQTGNAVINIDMYEGTIRDDDTEGDLVFSATGFTITASALSNPLVVPINDPIVTQTSGQDFNLHIAAYGTNPDDGTCGIIESYAGSKSLSVATTYSNPTTGTLNASGSGSVSFSNGQGVVTSRYDDVGQISLSVSDGAAGISGQSNTFVVKPADFSVAVADNPATTDSGSGLVASGEAFTVNVQALNALGNPTPNYGNEQTPESVTVAINALVFPSGGNVGSLANAGSFSKISSDTFQNNLITWSEVGSITLNATVADGDYLGAGDVSGSASGTIGRFYPHSFYLSSEAVANSCSSFTYLSQPDLSVIYNLSAINVDGQTTTNYDAGLGYPVGTIDYHAELDNNGVDLGSRLSTSTGTWSGGDYSIADTAAVFARTSALEAPLNNMVFGISVSDGDSRPMNNPGINASTSDDCVAGGSCNAQSLGTASFYFGRLVLPDAYGPETAALPAGLKTEYWDGQKFLSNVYDNCTVIPRSVMTFNGTAITTAGALSIDLAGGTTTAQFGNLDATNIGLASGDAGLVFSAPGVSITTKSFLINTDLTSIPWLRSDWNQNGNYDDDISLPTATISFKTYRGHDRVLYWRHK